jgi:hypothetical protein
VKIIEKFLLTFNRLTVISFAMPEYTSPATVPILEDIRLVAALNRQSVARVVLDAQEDYVKTNAATVKQARKTFKKSK